MSYAISPRVDNVVIENLWSGSRVVPLDFLGQHTKWPKSGAQPSYSYGVTRNHDYPTSSSHGWYSVHTADGVFNWTDMDQWVSANYAAGKNLVYMIYGTPAWLASNSVLDPYNIAGGASVPTNLAKLAEFVTALMQRYNGDGVRRIQYVEAWNEPPLDNPFQSKSYFNGTPDELAAMTRVVAQAARAVDPGVKILSPGFQKGGLIGPVITMYLNGADGVGGHARDWIDGVAFHPYHWVEDRIPYHYASYSLYNFKDNIDSIIQGVVDGGLPATFPIYATETGYKNAGTTSVGGVNYTGQFATDRMTNADWNRWLKRHAALLAAYGARQVIFYRHDLFNVGAPETNPTVAQTFADIAAALPGATIKSVDKMLFGQYRVTTDRGVLDW